MERTEEAVTYVKRLHDIDASHTEALDILGMCFSKLKDKETAKFFWKKALETNPDLRQVKNRLRELDNPNLY